MALVDYVVAAYLEVFGTYADGVVEEVLVLVHGIVLVDVFDVRCRLVCCAVCLVALVRVRRVALRVVDILVAFDDRGLGIVVVAATEVVVVVGCRVFGYCLIGGVADRTLDGVEEVGIDAVSAFVVVGETVQTEVLLLACSCFVAEGITTLFSEGTRPHIVSA